MDRGTSPVVGVLLLIALTVIAATAVGALVSTDLTDPPPSAAFDVTATPETNEISLTHQRGDEIDLTAVDIRVTVAGEPLQRQPPVPFFSAAGFQPGPEGPFNSASPNQWEPGETATFRIASTNDPELTAGDSVRIQIQTDRSTIADLTTTA